MSNNTQPHNIEHAMFLKLLFLIIFCFFYLLQLCCHPVAVVILHVNKT